MKSHLNVIFENCNQIFRPKSVLKSDSLIHSGLKPFKCVYNGCQREFRHRCGLRVYVRRHLDYKQFYWGFNNECKQTFVTKSELKTHLF